MLAWIADYLLRTVSELGPMIVVCLAVNWTTIDRLAVNVQVLEATRKNENVSRET